MKKTFANNGIASVAELRELCVEVKFIACQMTFDLFGFDAKKDLIEDLYLVGAASFSEFEDDSDICLYI